MNRFNPRLRPFDVALLVGLLAVLAPSLPFVIRTIFPGADVQVGIRLAFAIAIGAVFMRMKYFPSPHVEERPVSPSARLLSVVLFGFGGAVTVLGALIFAAMSVDLKQLTDTPWLLMPCVVMMIGGVIIWSGACARRSSK
jgi:uncharacterized membrane protein YidH (DUF202 family)